MSKYSTDSDSSGSRRRQRQRRRSSSESSTERRRRSHRSKHKSSSYYRSKSSRHKRRSRSRSSRRSRSTERNRRRSRSREVSKSSKSSKVSRSRRRSSSSKSSRSSSPSLPSSKSTPRRKANSSAATSADELREKLLQAIKAAESADTQLKRQGVLPKNVKSRNDISNLLVAEKPDIEIVEEIENDGFVPKSFKMSKKKSSEEVNILNVTDVGENAPDEKSLFHSSFFDDPKKKLDRWVKKLYLVRQKALRGNSPHAL